MVTADSDNCEKWCQTTENVETVEQIKNLYRKIQELTEQKFQIVPLLAHGGLTHSNKMKLLRASLFLSHFSAIFKREMDTEIYSLKEKLKTLSLTLNSPAKKNTCEYFEGEEIEMKAFPFKCFVDGCIKSNASQNCLLRHQRLCHPPSAKEMSTAGCTTIAHNSTRAAPMAFKRPALNAEVALFHPMVGFQVTLIIKKTWPTSRSLAKIVHKQVIKLFYSIFFPFKNNSQKFTHNSIIHTTTTLTQSIHSFIPTTTIPIHFTHHSIIHTTTLTQSFHSIIPTTTTLTQSFHSFIPPPPPPTSSSIPSFNPTPSSPNSPIPAEEVVAGSQLPLPEKDKKNNNKIEREP
ncbi:hypothetical protein OUZ56_012886 [Daphnia magna]|uniref:Uncharacterized protein n=1 Tax=Daphnia magna TaxID=35525 RepID=A0ABQ9Z4C6_9CRUS|nr:hypothetical protein OUZ56_012886 [Daphnia magna]